MIPKVIRKLLEVILRPATKSKDYLSKLYNVPKKLKKKVDIEAIIDKEYLDR